MTCIIEKYMYSILKRYSYFTLYGTKEVVGWTVQSPCDNSKMETLSLSQPMLEDRQACEMTMPLGYFLEKC